MHVTRRAAPRHMQRGQWSLIGLLVSLAVIMILSAWYYNRILKPAAGSHNGKPASEQAAYGAVCSEYQSQLNMASTMYKDQSGHNARSFEDLKKGGATEDIIRAQGCQFQLDPATGAVTDIGHGQAAPGAVPVVLGADAAPAAPPRRPGDPMVLTAPPPGGAPAPGDQPAAHAGPGGVTLPPSGGSGSVPADGGGGE